MYEDYGSYSNDAADDDFRSLRGVSRFLDYDGLAEEAYTECIREAWDHMERLYNEHCIRMLPLLPEQVEEMMEASE